LGQGGRDAGAQLAQAANRYFLNSFHLMRAGNLMKASPASSYS
jgi:hypothetical protein